MASSSGTSSGSLGSEETPQLVINQRKQKRMLSNRESARRSRQRKQNHLEGLAGQVEQIRKENTQIVTSLNITTQHYLNVEAENSVLRAQMAELNNRLQSLNDIINYMNPIGLETENLQTSIDYSYTNPWNSVYLNQPIVGSTDLFEY
ncbi:hypothetical protein ACHQM5_015400 [Ranunculus cassubicifolius]